MVLSVLVQFFEALRIFSRNIKVKSKGIKKYSGSDEEVCLKIINDCYNKDKKYFMVSAGHFCEFYARDFGWCTQALLSLGFKDKVIDTLDYALGIFEKHGRIEQAITPKGRAFTFPNKYSPDALAYIIQSLRLANAHALVKKYKQFLNKEIKRYFDVVIDPKTGLVKKNASFSSMKDYSIRKSSCYDNVITGMLANDLKSMKGLRNPFAKFNYKNLLIDNFWNGDYFFDELDGCRAVCGDANVLPFWSGLITDKNMLGKTINSIKNQKLDQPFPLKYAHKRLKEHKMILLEIFIGDYERDSVWAHIGPMYIEIVSMFDKKLAKKYLDQYKQQIDKHNNFLEVYDRDGNPFSTFFYFTDESMLWCANYLYLKKKMNKS